MSKLKKDNKCFFILMLSFLFILTFNFITYGEPLTKRLGGMDRYKTAVEISKEGWKTTSTFAILATGANFPDALSSAPLAKKLNAPILLTDKDSIPSFVMDELKRLNVKTVYLVGGSGVISSAVETQLKGATISFIRLAGINRYETAIKIAKEVGVGSGEIIVTNGYEFAEALSISSIAAKKQIPIILVNKDEYPDTVKTFLSDKKITKSYILGDTPLISDTVANKFPSSLRIVGTDKYERNINIIKAFEGEKDASGKNIIDFSTIYIATGRDYPDALAGSALAPMTNSTIILVDDTNLKECTREYIKAKLSGISTLTVFGLTGAVNDSAIQELKSQNSSSDSLKIIDIN